MTNTTTGAKQAQGDKVALMYPNNQLKAQVREYGETQSAFSVIQKTFFAKK